MKLAVISILLRRDLHTPFNCFKNIEVRHFYRTAPYNDLVKEEFGDLAVRYRGLLDLLKKVKEFSPDVIQGIEPYTFPGGFREYIVILFCNIFLKIPFFFPMLENRPVKGKFGAFLSIFVKQYLKFYARRAKFIIPLNNGARKNLEEVGIKPVKFRNILWGNWGVDVNEFTPQINGSEPSFGGSRVILFIGRLCEAKGIRYLLKAFFKLARWDVGDVKLLIVGDGPMRTSIEKMVLESFLFDKIIIAGNIKNKFLPSFYRSCYITVVPSITVKRWAEQVGMVNIQSMACGTPVVSTRSGAIPEFVSDGRGGLLVSERDSGELAAGMMRLLMDEGLKQDMSRMAREDCIERYDVQRNVKIAEIILLEEFGSR